MKNYRRTLTALAAILVAQLMAGAPTMAQAEDPSAYGDDYQVGNFGRVQYQENGVTILRAPSNFEGQEVEEALVNAPIFPGDSIVTGYDQRAETQLARGTLIRIDNGTEVTFLALPDPYAEFPDNTILQLAEGSIQISAALEEKEEFRIDTPAATVYLLGDGDFRIDVNAKGRSQVVSHRGVAEVVGNGGSVIVRGGMLAEVYPGNVPYQPVPFNTFASDGFDRWVDERDAVYRTRDRYAGTYEGAGAVYSDLPYEVRPYYRELNNYGDWTYVADYGHVWHPTGVSVGWRPYYDGYWRYGPHGYFWVSHEPWGWAPYHYGRWTHVSGVGWCWIPGRVFGGAWVAWSWGSSYVGWAPLGYWNRPVWVNSLYWDYYDPYSWTFVGYKHFHHRHYRRHAVHVNHIHDHLKRHAVVTRPPRVSPRKLADSVEHRRRAMRQVADDERARVRPIVKDRRPERTVRNLEEGMARRRAGTRPSERFSAPDRRSRPDRASRGERGVLPSSGVDRGKRAADGGRDKVTGGRGRPMPTYPRRLTEAGEETKRVTGRQPARGSRVRTGTDEPRSTGRATPPTRVKPRQTEAGDSSERVRDLYRKASSPRTTRERTTPPRSDRGTERTAPPKTQPAPRRNTPTRTQPRSGSSSRDTSKARTPARRSGGSQPKASPRRSSGSGGSKPKASPRSGSRSGGSKSSGASRGGSRSGGSKSSGASRGGSRSGGSKSSGSSSRGGSRGRSGGSKSSGGRGKK
jgi:hypothetical protein